MHPNSDLDSAKLKSDGQRRSRNFLNSINKQSEKRGFSKKKLSRKLEKLITLNYNQKMHKSEQPDSLLAVHLRNLLSFKYYHSFGRDGNSLFRIVGVYHVYWMLGKEGEWERMLAVIESERFDVQMLTNVPPDFMPYFKKPKLLELLKGLVESVRKKLEKDNDLLKIMGAILNTYTIFDFAIVSIYRLYSYYEGFLYLEVELSDILEGTERQSLLVYDREATQVVVKILSECFRARINLYSIYNHVNLEFMCYSPAENTQFEFNVMHNGKAHYVLDEKGQTEVLHRNQPSKQSEEAQVPEADYSHHQYSEVVFEESRLAGSPRQFVRPVRSDVIELPQLDRQASNEPVRRPITRPTLPPPLETQRYVEIKAQEEELLEEIYLSLSERQRKQIVVQHLKRKFEQKYLQVKHNLERELKRKQDPNPYSVGGLSQNTQFRPL